MVATLHSGKEIAWVSTVWEVLWSEDHKVKQKFLLNYFESMQQRDIAAWKFFHDLTGKLRLPLDMNFKHQSVVWARAEDFKWNPVKRVWIVENTLSAGNYCYVITT